MRAAGKDERCGTRALLFGYDGRDDEPTLQGHPPRTRSGVPQHAWYGSMESIIAEMLTRG
jgi:hypothetical protein